MLNALLPLISSPWLYAVVFVVMAIDGFLPFLPCETMIIGLSALSVSGSPNMIALGTAATAGAMTGDRITYLLGRKAGGRITKGRAGRAKEKAERALLRHGPAAILVGRFIPYGRMSTAMTAGSVSMPLRRFTLFTGLAGAAWSAWSIGLGQLGGVAFAHTPLLGAACGAALGFLVGAIHTLTEKRRTAKLHPATHHAESAALTRATLPSPEREPATDGQRRLSGGSGFSGGL